MPLNIEVIVIGTVSGKVFTKTANNVYPFEMHLSLKAFPGNLQAWLASKSIVTGSDGWACASAGAA